MKRPGRDCWHADCPRTVDDGPLFRTRPKGEPGEFMCANHASGDSVKKT